MRWGWLWLLLVISAGRLAAEPLVFLETVGGVERRALVFPGHDAFNTPAPLLFAFHGFAGSPTSMAATKFHEYWPEATVIYPLGLPQMSTRYQREVPAWQPVPGRNDDRDVAFIDALLEDLRATLKVDDRRIYATGISNGAMFTYILLVERPRLFAAFAGVAAGVSFANQATMPRPVLMIHGKYDETAPLPSAIQTRDILRTLNGCGADIVEWAPGYLTYRPCATGQPVIWHLHDGGHVWPGDATKMIVKFFKQQELPAADVGE